MKTVDDFLKEYSPNNYLFDKVDYRKGARITGIFGLDEGYSTTPSGGIVFDTVRIHTGVDRSAIYNSKGQTIENVVIAPFNFNRSACIFYGPKTSYGFLIQLFNDDYGFEMRIAHMNPESDVRPEVYEILKKHGAIPAGTILGKAGNFGLSGGMHTHTEFLSIGLTCKTFDDLLSRQFSQEDVFSEVSKMEILKLYQNKAKFIGKSTAEIFEHYEGLKKLRGVTFINKFYYKFFEAESKIKRTRYSSQLLFNGL